MCRHQEICKKLTPLHLYLLPNDKSPIQINKDCTHRAYNKEIFCSSFHFISARDQRCWGKGKKMYWGEKGKFYRVKNRKI